MRDLGTGGFWPVRHPLGRYVQSLDQVVPLRERRLGNPGQNRSVIRKSPG